MSGKGWEMFERKGCTQGWVFLGIGLSQQRLTFSLEHTPSLGRVDALVFALPGRRKKSTAQGERGSFEVLRDQLNVTLGLDALYNVFHSVSQHRVCPL